MGSRRNEILPLAFERALGVPFLLESLFGLFERAAEFAEFILPCEFCRLKMGFSAYNVCGFVNRAPQGTADQGFGEMVHAEQKQDADRQDGNSLIAGQFQGVL